MSGKICHLESDYGVNPERANRSPLSLLHMQPSLNFSPFQGACKTWDAGTLEPTSVLDLGSPSPSSRAVSSISGSLDDRATVSSSSLLHDESEKKAQAGSDGGGYLGREKGGMSRRWMVGKAVEGEVGDNNYKEAVQSSNTVDWCAKNFPKRNAAGNEQINNGGDIISTIPRTEERSFFGNNDKANVETFQSVGVAARSSQPFLFTSGKQCETGGESGSMLEENRHGSFSKIIPTGARNPSVDPAGDNHNFLTGVGFGSATISRAQGYNTASESLCGSSIGGENNDEWRSEATRIRGLDDLLADLQGYSELPLHEDLVEAVHCGMVNLDSMIYNSPAPESLMKRLLWENDRVQTMEESLNGAELDEGLSSKLHFELHDKTIESSFQLQSPSLATTKARFPTPIQMTDNIKVTSSSQSAFPSLECRRATPALVQVPAFPKFTETSLFNFCHPSGTILSHDNNLPSPSLSSFQGMNIQTRGAFPPIHNNQDVLRPRVQTLSHSGVQALSRSGVQALISRNQLMSSSPDNFMNLSDPSFTQETYVSQSTLLDGSSDQSIYPTHNVRKHHLFQLPSLPSISASQPPVDFYLFNSCQQINPNMLQRPISGQPEISGFHQLAGRKNQHPGASPSVGLELQPYHYLGTNPDGGATWQAKVQMGLMREEILLGSKQYNFPVGASHQSSIGFSSSDKKELQAHQLHYAAQGPSENADEGLALVNQLFQLVEALETGDPDVARSILARLNRYPLSQNKYIQRVVLYFREALAARLMSISQCSGQILSPLEFLQKVTAHYRFCEASPFLSFAHFMANQAILEALEGEESVHVIDFEISFGGQWASFLQDFALKPGNARRLRITAVGFQQDEMYFAGERLCSFAKDHNVLLDFQMVVTKPESLTSEMLPVRGKEPIAVNFVLGRHRMLGESPNSIDTILAIVKGLSPKVVTVVEKELDDNSPYLQTRFLEALSYYSYLSDLLGAGDLDNETIMFIEKFLFMPEILDIVICERLTRVEQYKGLQRWRQRFLSAGFSNIPLSNLAETNAHCLIRRTAFQGYEILKNEGSILLGWRGKTLLAASAWTC